MSAYSVDPWSALGDRTRRTIFTRIARRPCNVAELARELPVSRPAVSQHLRVLREAGLVTFRAEGTRRVYAADPAGLHALRTELEGFWSSALVSFKTIVEQEESP